MLKPLRPFFSCIPLYTKKEHPANKKAEADRNNAIKHVRISLCSGGFGRFYYRLEPTNLSKNPKTKDFRQLLFFLAAVQDCEHALKHDEETEDD